MLIGLYRVGGVGSKVQQLYHLLFEKGRAAEALSAPDLAPRTVTSAVKKFFSSMPVRPLPPPFPPPRRLPLLLPPSRQCQRRVHCRLT